LIFLEKRVQTFRAVSAYRPVKIQNVVKKGVLIMGYTSEKRYLIPSLGRGLRIVGMVIRAWEPFTLGQIEGFNSAISGWRYSASPVTKETGPALAAMASHMSQAGGYY
jgi:hypothetical protein